MKNILPILGLSTSIGVFIVSYLVYKRDIPSLDTLINIIPDDGNELVLRFKNEKRVPQSSTAGFFVNYQIANSGFRTITAIAITNEKNETIIPLYFNRAFGRTLKEGEIVSELSDCSQGGAVILKNAKKLYIKDTADRKHLVKNDSWKEQLKSLNSFKP